MRKRAWTGVASAEDAWTDDGAEAQIRTGDTGLFRAVLYQLSYLGTVAGTTGFEPAISGVTIQRPRPD